MIETGTHVNFTDRNGQTRTGIVAGTKVIGSDTMVDIVTSVAGGALLHVRTADEIETI